MPCPMIRRAASPFAASDHGMAHLAEIGGGHAADLGVVVHQKDVGLPGRRRRHRRRRRPISSRPWRIAPDRARRGCPGPGCSRSSRSRPIAGRGPYTIGSPRPVPLPTSLVVKNGSKTRFRISGGMPSPVSDTRHDHVVAGGQVRRSSSAPIVTLRVARVEDPALRHGVARVDAQVEDGEFELVRVDHGGPETRRPRSLSIRRSSPPRRAGQQVVHVVDDLR